MRTPDPVIVVDLFPELHDELLKLLSTLSPEEWSKSTSNPKWNVKDIASHLLWDDLGRLSRQRDHFTAQSGSVKVQDWNQLVGLLNKSNEEWVVMTRGFSPQVVCDLLKLTGVEVCHHFRSLDPFGIGGPVSWAGTDPAPIWLDIAREYTEKWHHQQQIRDSVQMPGLKEPKYMKPVLETFVRALPQTYKNVNSQEGTHVRLSIRGESGGTWSIVMENKRWTLFVENQTEADAESVIGEDDAWRLFTRTVSKETVLPGVTVNGEKQLGLRVMDMVSVIA